MDKKEFNWLKIHQIFKVPDFLPKNFAGGMPPLPSIISVQSAISPEMTDCGDTKPGDTVESDLLEIGKNAIRASQLQGYFPLTYCKSTDNNLSSFQRLSFSPKSFPFLWTILIIAVQISLSYLWYYLVGSSGDLYRILRVVRFTEKLALSTVAVSVSSVIMGRRIYGIFCHKHTLKFWSEFTQLIKKFQGSHHNCSRVLKSPIFTWVKTSIDRNVYENVVVTILFCLYFGVAVSFRNYRELGQNWTLTYFIGYLVVSVAWNATGCAHVFITAWTTFPLKIIQGLLLSLKEELNLAIVRKSRKLREGWIEDYHRIDGLVELYTCYFERSLMVEIAYNSIQILCQCFSAFSWILSGLITSTVSRSIPVFLALRTIFQLANEAGRVTELHGEVYKSLCRLETELEDETIKEKVRLSVKFKLMAN